MHGSKESMCYGYNLGTCELAVVSGKCKKGWHKCMFPVNGVACIGDHPQERLPRTNRSR